MISMKSTNCTVRLVLCLTLLFAAASVSVAENKIMNSSTNHTETAVFGGGCYWCTEAIYQMISGVKSVASGFAGGAKENPTYDEVCTGTTGHAEVIQIEYDPAVVSYEKLLDTFWEAHDPTTLNSRSPEKLQKSNRNSNCPAQKILASGRLSSELFSDASEPALLPGRHSAQGRKIRKETEGSGSLSRDSPAGRIR